MQKDMQIDASTFFMVRLFLSMLNRIRAKEVYILGHILYKLHYSDHVNSILKMYVI
jgi:hypothetical protein